MNPGDKALERIITDEYDAKRWNHANGEIVAQLLATMWTDFPPALLGGFDADGPDGSLSDLHHRARTADPLLFECAQIARSLWAQCRGPEDLNVVWEFVNNLDYRHRAAKK